MNKIFLLFVIAGFSLTQGTPNFVTINQLLAASNQVRANPSILVPIFENEFKAFMNCNGNNGANQSLNATTLHTGWGLNIQEGCAGLNEAINDANNRVKYPIVPPLKIDEGLTEVAHEQSVYQVSLGVYNPTSQTYTNSVLSHFGPPNVAGQVAKYSLGDRIKIRNNQYFVKTRENIIDSRGGFSHTALRIIAFLFLDAGLPSRGHRVNLLSGDVHYIGIGIHPFTVSGLPRDKITLQYGNVAACCRIG